MQEYRERGQQVRAIQVTEANLPAIAAAFNELRVEACWHVEVGGQRTLLGAKIGQSYNVTVAAAGAGDWLLESDTGHVSAQHDAVFRDLYEPIERPADAIRDAAARHALTEQIAAGLRALTLLHESNLDHLAAVSRWEQTDDCVRQNYRADALDRFPCLAPEAE